MQGPQVPPQVLVMPPVQLDEGCNEVNEPQLLFLMNVKPCLNERFLVFVEQGKALPLIY